MKTSLICTAVLAMSTSFSTFAQDAVEDLVGPTVACVGALASEPRLAAIADKIDVAPFPFAVKEQTPNRVANGQERKLIARWMEHRDSCFQAGAEYRMKTLLPEEQSYASSLFAVQQALTVKLLQGRMTYNEFNHTRFDLFKSAEYEAGTLAAYAGW